MKGQNLRLALVIENIKKYIAGALTFDLTYQCDTSEATTKDSTGGFKEYEAGLKGWSGSGQCKLTLDAAEVAALKGFEIFDLVGKKVNATFDEVNGDKNRSEIVSHLNGDAIITEWKLGAQNGEDVNIDFSFQGTGELKHTPAIEGKKVVELHPNGTETIEVYNTIDGAAITAETDADWLTVSTSANKVVFKPTTYHFEDEGADPREAFVVVRSGASLLKVTVKQAKMERQAGPVISGRSCVTLQADGTAWAGNYNTSDGSKVAAKSFVPWLTVNVADEGEDVNKVTFTPQPYAYVAGGDNPRQTTVIVSVPNTDSTFEVTVKQQMAPAEAPVIDGPVELEVRTVGQTLKRQYATSDGSAIEAVSDSDWLQVSVLNNKVTFTAVAYPYIPAGENPREAIVTLSVPGTTASLEVSVKQPMGAQPTISGDDEYEFEAEGGEKGGDYVASDGKAIEANCEAEWLTVAIEDGHLTITAEEYPYAEEGENPREAIVTLTTETYAEKVITISQAMGEAPAEEA